MHSSVHVGSQSIPSCSKPSKHVHSFGATHRPWRQVSPQSGMHLSQLKMKSISDFPEYILHRWQIHEILPILREHFESIITSALIRRLTPTIFAHVVTVRHTFVIFQIVASAAVSLYARYDTFLYYDKETDETKGIRIEILLILHDNNTNKSQKVWIARTFRTTLVLTEWYRPYQRFVSMYVSDCVYCWGSLRKTNNIDCRKHCSIWFKASNWVMQRI